MIVVTGSVTPGKIPWTRSRRLSLEHVHRSRKEPGCISHAVHVDCEFVIARRSRFDDRDL
jgi:quinol monooxygenase YgiN